MEQAYLFVTGKSAEILEKLRTSLNEHLTKMLREYIKGIEEKNAELLEAANRSLEIREMKDKETGNSTLSFQIREDTEDGPVFAEAGTCLVDRSNGGNLTTQMNELNEIEAQLDQFKEKLRSRNEFYREIGAELGVEEDMRAHIDNMYRTEEGIDIADPEQDAMIEAHAQAVVSKNDLKLLRAEHDRLEKMFNLEMENASKNGLDYVNRKEIQRLSKEIHDNEVAQLEAKENLHPIKIGFQNAIENGKQGIEKTICNFTDKCDQVSNNIIAAELAAKEKISEHIKNATAKVQVMGIEAYNRAVKDVMTADRANRDSINAIFHAENAKLLDKIANGLENIDRMKHSFKENLQNAAKVIVGDYSGVKATMQKEDDFQPGKMSQALRRSAQKCRDTSLSYKEKAIKGFKEIIERNTKTNELRKGLKMKENQYSKDQISFSNKKIDMLDRGIR